MKPNSCAAAWFVAKSVRFLAAIDGLPGALQARALDCDVARLVRIRGDRRLVLPAICALVATIGAVRAGAAAEPARPTHLLVVSIDGLAWQRLQPALPRLGVLRSLVEAGASGPLQTVFPSMTWAAHASIATGRNPGGHGVLGNRYYDRNSDDLVETWQRDAAILRAPALWQVAKAAGWTTAALLWPQTSRAQGLDWQVPEVYGQRNFESGSTPGLLGQLQAQAGLPVGHIGKLGSDEAFLLDSWVRDAAVWLIETKKPRLALVHFLSVDTFSHAWGPAAVEPRWGLELVDRYLGDVINAYQRAGLRDKLLICVVSDHGFLELTEAFSPWEALQASPLKPAEKSLIRFAINGQAVFVSTRGAPILQAAPAPPPPKSKKARPPKLSPAESALLKLKAYLRSLPQVEGIVEQDQYADLGLGSLADDPNLPEFIAMLRPDVQSVQGNRAAPRGKILVGGHGYLPTHAPLLGAFILAGPGAQRLQIKDMRAIDVAPTLGRAFGWTWPGPTDGVIRQDLLKLP